MEPSPKIITARKIVVDQFLFVVISKRSLDRVRSVHIDRATKKRNNKQQLQFCNSLGR